MSWDNGWCKERVKPWTHSLSYQRPPRLSQAGKHKTVQSLWQITINCMHIPTTHSSVGIKNLLELVYKSREFRPKRHNNLQQHQHLIRTGQQYFSCKKWMNCLHIHYMSVLHVHGCGTLLLTVHRANEFQYLIRKFHPHTNQQLKTSTTHSFIKLMLYSFAKTSTLTASQTVQWTLLQWTPLGQKLLYGCPNS